MTELALAIPLMLAQPADNPLGYLTPQAKASKADKTPKAGKPVKEIAYAPREGDLIFYDDHSVPWTILFALAGTGPPLHMGIVVKKSDGGMAVLEAGPDDSLKVFLLDLAPRLQDFEGHITIRRCKVVLTKEKSAALTKFAHAQEGKPYAVLRLLLQGTSFRSRGPVREWFLARTVLDRWSWICSELAVAAGTVAGLFDPRVVRANVTYPADIVDNHRFDLRRTWHDPETWNARPREKAPKAPR
jgi:hypothetical protein